MSTQRLERVGDVYVIASGRIRKAGYTLDLFIKCSLKVSNLHTETGSTEFCNGPQPQKFHFVDQQTLHKPLTMAPRVKRKEKKQEENVPEPPTAEKETVEEVEQEDKHDEELSSDSEEESADEENEADKDEEGIPLSDLDSDAGEGEDVDIVPYTKVFKDNHAALTQALSTFALPISSLPFHVHQSVTSTESVTIDVNDDLQRELAFYKQALEAAKGGRKQLSAEGIPFSRPPDYFAEMVKDDEHMEKVSVVP